MQSLAGPCAQIHFTHLSRASSIALQHLFSSPQSNHVTSNAKVDSHSIGVLELLKNTGASLDKVCLLDPKAPQELSPDDGDGRFDCFLFGVGLSSPSCISCADDGGTRGF